MILQTPQGSPINTPPAVIGTPSRVQEYEVTLVNADGTIDARQANGRTNKHQVAVPDWYPPSAGDRVLILDVDGNQQDPRVIAPITCRRGIGTGVSGRTVVDFGADPTGTTDAATAFNAAFAAGTGIVPDGTFYINDVVTVPYTSDFRGNGPGRSIINLGPNGQIRHGQLAVGPTLPGGRTSGLRFDGGGVQNVVGGAVWVGQAQSRTFADLVIRNGKRQGLRIEQAQNCRFDNVTIQLFDGPCLNLDNGTGGHKFDKCEIGVSKDYAVRIEQTVAIVPGLYSAPSYNTWDGCIIEYLQASAPGMVYSEGGAQNIFTNTSINPTGATAANDAIHLARAAAAVTEVILNNCDLYGTAGETTGVSMSGGTVLTLEGRNRFFTMLTGISMAFGVDELDRLGKTDFYGVTTKFVDTGGSGMTWIEDVQSLTLAANVSAFGAGVSPGEIYLQPGGAGIVRCRGALKTSVDKVPGDPIFSLPAGMGLYPNYGDVFFCAIGVGGSPFVGGNPATLAIGQDGVARLSAGLPAAGGYGVFFDFTYQTAKF